MEAGETEQLVVAGWPKDLRLVDLRARVRQHVIDAQIARPRIVVEVACVVLRIRLVLQVGPTLELRLAGPALRGRHRVDDSGAGQELVDGSRVRIAVQWIGVVVPENHKVRIGGQAALDAIVVVEVVGPVRYVVGPHADLVKVAFLIALLGSVERGRGRVSGENVDGRAVDIDRQVGVRLRREGEALEYLVGVPARAVGVGRKEGARHVLPQEVLERADLVGLNRVFRVDDETVLTRELAETPGVARAVVRPVLIQVEAAGHAGVDGTRPGVGIGDGGGAVMGDLEVVLAKEVNSRRIRVVVELVDQNDVWIHALDGFCDVGRLGIA